MRGGSSPQKRFYQSSGEWDVFGQWGWRLEGWPNTEAQLLAGGEWPSMVLFWTLWMVHCRLPWRTILLAPRWNSWKYNFVEVYGNNLEISQSWGFYLSSFCLFTKCYSWTNLSILHWLICIFYNFLLLYREIWLLHRNLHSIGRETDTSRFEIFRTVCCINIYIIYEFFEGHLSVVLYSY